MGVGYFRPPTAPRPLDRFSRNLKYITTSRTRPRMQTFRGLCRRGWSGQIASLTHESFCFFSFLSHAHRSHFWTHPNAQYVIMRRSRQGSAFCGLEISNLKFDPLYRKNPKKFGLKAGGKWKIVVVLTLNMMIMFKLGTGIDHPSGIT